MEKYIWTIICLLMMGIFLLLGLLFALLKEKACMLISGYNFKTAEERKDYDEERLSRDMRNFLFVCGGIFLLGGIAAFLWGIVCFWISLIVWLIYFFKNVHMDDEKAFGKYRL
jgi:hypothetical protein